MMNIDDKGNGRLFVVWDDDCSPRLLASSGLYVRCIVRSYFSRCHYSKLISEENFEYCFTSKKKENCKHSSPIRDPVYRPLFKRYALQCILTACKNKYDPLPRPKYQTKRRISPPPLSTTIQLTVASDIIFTKRIVKSFLK